MLTYFQPAVFIFAQAEIDFPFFLSFFQQLLKHHLIPGTILSSSLSDNMVAQSALGTPLRVKFYESEDMEWRPLKVKTEKEEKKNARDDAPLERERTAI